MPVDRVERAVGHLLHLLAAMRREDCVIDEQRHPSTTQIPPVPPRLFRCIPRAPLLGGRPIEPDRGAGVEDSGDFDPRLDQAIGDSENDRPDAGDDGAVARGGSAAF